MTTGRTFETGGEVLRVGSTVIAFDGNMHREVAVTDIGTKRIHLESLGRGKPVPYDKDTRRSLQGAYASVFRTKTEMADQQRRDLLRAKLRDLGFEVRVSGTRDWLAPYTTDFLENLVEIIHANNRESQQG